MSKVQDPFFYSQLECPVCKTINEFVNIKTGAYTESGRDTDFCPTGRVWQNPAYQKFDPLQFFMATCRKCYYTREFDNDYKNWQKDTSFKTYRLKSIQEKHMAGFLDENGVIKLLGSHIDDNRYPNESAIIKFLLGIFDEKCLDRPSKLNIGRYFIRIGWLFRTHNLAAGQSQEGASGFLARLTKAAMSTGDLIRDYRTRLADIESQFNRDYKIALSDFSDIEMLAKEFNNRLKRVVDMLEPLTKANAELSQILLDTKQKSVSQQTADSQNNYFEYPTFHDFLQQAKLKWSEIPLTEIEALTSARDYYKQAYESGDKVTKGIGQLQATYLIAELSRRIGDQASAMDYFNIVIREARDFVHGKKGDASSINYAKKLLEMAMDQARKSMKEKEAVTV